MSARSIDEVEAACRLAVELGFDTALLSPAVSLFTADLHALTAFVARGHAAGARVLLRLPDRVFEGLSGAGLDVAARRAAVLVLVRAAVEAGADGIDLHAHAACLHGEGEAGTRARERFSELVRLVEAEAESAEEGPLIVTAAIEDADPVEVRSHLEEEWFHHLREDALRAAPFRADLIEEALSESLGVRDRLGAITAWSLPLPEASDARGLGRMLHALSLPGAIRALGALPGAGASRAGAIDPTAEVVGPDALETVRRALEIRSGTGLGTGSLGLVHGLPWCGEGVSVHLNGPIMVVLNASDAPVAVPRTAALLVSSSPTESTPEGDVLVPASACAWFETPRIRPVAAQFWD